MFNLIYRKYGQGIRWKDDMLSGLTVALALVPEAVAFAFVAGVDPLVGLYAAFFVGFITAAFDFRLSQHWNIRLAATDFFGEDPYKAVGLLRDRDEVNLRVRFQF